MNVCCISQSSIKTPFKGDRWFWCHFVTDLLEYMCTNTYSNRERFDKVIAKIKWCITHHWSGPTTAPLKNGCCNDDVIHLGPFRSQLLCWLIQISSVCFLQLLLQYFLHNVIKWIQIWWIWRPQYIIKMRLILEFFL